MKYTFIVLIISNLLIIKTTLAQTNCTQFFPIGNITSMTETETVFWLGTKDKGLAEFDKNTLTTQYFDTLNTPLNTNHITSTYWHNNTLYLSTDNGLWTFNNNSFMLINDTINGLLIESSNQELIVVDVEMVYFLQNNQIIYQKDLNTIATVRQDCCGFNTEVKIDNIGNLWISRYDFYEFDIIKFDGNNWTSFHSNNTTVLPIESYTFNGLCAYNDTILATSWSGIHLYTQGNWSSFLDIHHFNSFIVNGQDTLYHNLASVEKENNSNRIWAGSNGEDFQEPARLLYKEGGNNWVFIPLFDAVPATIKKIIAGTSNVYIGTSTGFGILDKSCLMVTTNQIPSANLLINIYPNPSSTIINIENISNLTIEHIKLYDVQGRLLETNMNTEQIDISKYSNGIYFLKFQTEKGVFSRKIQIEK